MLAEKISANILRRASSYKPAGYRASEAGILCARYHYHCRQDWQLRPAPDEELAHIFALGQELEGYVRRLLEEAGVTVIMSQSPYYDERMDLVGHIDGIIELDGVRYVLEIKSISEWAWERVRTWRDMAESDSPILAKWALQLPLYLWLTDHAHGLYLLINKQSGQLREIHVTLDEAWPLLERADEVLRAAEDARRVGRPPEPAPDSASLCRYCWAQRAGLCEGVTEPVPDGVDVAAAEEAAAVIAATREAHRQYEAAQERLKKALAGVDVPPGSRRELLLGGSQPVVVRVSAYEQTRYDVPPEVRQQYATRQVVRRVEVLGG